MEFSAVAPCFVRSLLCSYFWSSFVSIPPPPFSLHFRLLNSLGLVYNSATRSKQSINFPFALSLKNPCEIRGPTVQAHIRIPATDNLDPHSMDIIEPADLDSLDALLIPKPGFRIEGVKAESGVHAVGTRKSLPSGEQKWTWLLACACGVTLLITFLYGWALSSPSGPLASFIAIDNNPMMSIRIVRILSEIVSILLTGFVAVTSGLAMWLIASTDRGLTVATWLAMSPSTNFVGLVKLFLWPWRNRSNSWNLHLIWIIVRYYLATNRPYFLGYSSCSLFPLRLCFFQVRKPVNDF